MEVWYHHQQLKTFWHVRRGSWSRSINKISSRELLGSLQSVPCGKLKPGGPEQIASEGWAAYTGRILKDPVRAPDQWGSSRYEKKEKSHIMRFSKRQEPETFKTRRSIRARSQKGCESRNFQRVKWSTCHIFNSCLVYRGCFVLVGNGSTFHIQYWYPNFPLHIYS